MSPFKHKEGNGSLWDNENKENESQPDMRGKVTLPDSEEKSLAGWWNESSTGKRYLSVSISDLPVKADEDESEGKDKAEPQKLEEADDLPF